MKQLPYKNADGHVVFPSPNASEVAEWPYEPLSDEEILEAGGDPDHYPKTVVKKSKKLDPETNPALFDNSPVTEDELEEN